MAWVSTTDLLIELLSFNNIMQQGRRMCLAFFNQIPCQSMIFSYSIGRHLKGDDTLRREKISSVLYASWKLLILSFCRGFQQRWPFCNGQLFLWQTTLNLNSHAQCLCSYTSSIFSLRNSHISLFVTCSDFIKKIERPLHWLKIQAIKIASPFVTYQVKKYQL